MLVLDRRVGPDDRRARQLLGSGLADLGVQLAGGEAAALDRRAAPGPLGLAAAIGASRPSRASVSVPRV